MDVAVGVALLAIHHDDLGVSKTKLRLVLTKFHPPHRVGSAIELLADEVERLPAVGLPVGNLTATAPRETPVGKHVHPAELLERRLRRETPDVDHGGDDARRDLGAAPFDGLENLLEHVELFHRLREITFAVTLFFQERLQNDIGSFASIERLLHTPLGHEAVGRAKDVANEPLAQTLFARDARLHGVSARGERLAHEHEREVAISHRIKQLR